MKKIILTLTVISTLSFIGCQSNSGNPKSVLTNFFNALANKNIEEAKKYVTSDSQGMLSMLQMGMNNMPDSADNMYKKENIIIGEPVIDGDRATIPVKEKVSGEETNFVLKNESGEWKVAFDKATIMEMGKQKMKEKGISGMEELDNLNIDSVYKEAAEKMKNISKEDMEKVSGMMDSASKVLKKLQEEGKMGKMMDSATKMLEMMQKNAN